MKTQQPDDRGSGITFFKPPREPFRWFPVLVVVGVALGGTLIVMADFVLLMLAERVLP